MNGENSHAALKYAARGWPVFPCAGKRPRTRNGLKDASTDAEKIADWWAMWPDAGVAIRTGDGLVVLDVDGEEGADALHGLEARHGELPETPSVLTGGGGVHYHLAGTLANTARKLGAGLDTRGDGGYVIAPPSVHPDTGRRYEWDIPPEDAPRAPLPGWIEQLLAPERAGGGARRPASEWRTLAAEGAVEGERNQRTAQLAGHLLARGVDPFVALELLAAWDAHRSRPPLGRDEVTRTVASIAKREVAKW